MDHGKWTTRQEAAVFLGVDVEDIDRLIGAGLLLRYRLAGRYVRLLRAQVEELGHLDAELLRDA